MLERWNTEYNMFYVWKIAALFHKENILKNYSDFQLKNPTNQTSNELTTEWILNGYWMMQNFPE